MDNFIFPNLPLDSSSGRTVSLVYQSADYEYQVEISIVSLGNYRLNCYLLVNSGDASEMFKGMLTVIQFLIVAVVWKFAQIQSTIFYYQQIITENEKHSSGLQRRFFLFGGIAITVLTIGIIEMLKFIM